MYSGKQFTHFICREKRFMHFFVGKTIYALCLESFCALNFAIRKVHTFGPLCTASFRNAQLSQLDLVMFSFSSRWKAKRILTTAPAIRWLKTEIPTAAPSKPPLTRSMRLFLLYRAGTFIAFLSLLHNCLISPVVALCWKFVSISFYHFAQVFFLLIFRKAHTTLFVVLAPIVRMESKRLNNSNILVLNFLKKCVSKF